MGLSCLVNKPKVGTSSSSNISVANSFNNRNQGELPNKMEVNMREHVNAITLRSSRQLEDPPIVEKV